MTAKLMLSYKAQCRRLFLLVCLFVCLSREIEGTAGLNTGREGLIKSVSSIDVFSFDKILEVYISSISGGYQCDRSINYAV